jgi:hypothetical protein
MVFNGVIYLGLVARAVSKALVTAWHMFNFLSLVGSFNLISLVLTFSEKSILRGGGPDEKDLARAYKLFIKVRLPHSGAIFG